MKDITEARETARSLNLQSQTVGGIHGLHEVHRNDPSRLVTGATSIAGSGLWILGFLFGLEARSTAFTVLLILSAFSFFTALFTAPAAVRYAKRTNPKQIGLKMFPPFWRFYYVAFAVGFLFWITHQYGGLPFYVPLVGVWLTALVSVLVVRSACNAVWEE